MTSITTAPVIITKPINEIFPTIEVCDAIKNGFGDISKYEILEPISDTSPLKAFIPEIDETYVFPPEELVSLLIGLDARFNKPVLLWGYHGSGKTTLAEQACARSNRPCISVPHDVGTEASDVVGQWTIKGKETVFEYGPLARAMRDGLVYIADEYDFALPNVLSIYQNVLNGGSLFIKNAPAEMAIVRPHKNFRFIATGNTNGSGDEIGLYQGTQIQNAANYSRFGITIKLDYQAANVEREIIKNKTPGLSENHINFLIKFAGMVREAFANKTISNTLSTRELVNICKLAVLRAKKSKLNWEYGVEVGFINRMQEIDRKAIRDIAKKVFTS